MPIEERMTKNDVWPPEAIEEPTQLEIIKPGSFVKVAKDVRAQVVSACINQGGLIEYKVSWFSGRSRHCEWLQAGELTKCEDTERTLVGFAGVAQ